MNNREDNNDSSFRRFFKNSCSENGEDVVNESTEFVVESEDCCAAARPKPSVDERDAMMQKGMNLGGRGSFTCCVPGCVSNSNVDHSFSVIPNGKSKENILLQKNWLHLILRKGFQPTDGHRVCSQHFVPSSKANLFALTFASNSNLEDQDFQAPLNLTSTITMSPIKFSTRKVRKVLLQLNTSKSNGPDIIPAIILKSCAPELAAVLNKLFQLSYNLGIFPSSWKLDHVFPIPKKVTNVTLKTIAQ